MMEPVAYRWTYDLGQAWSVGPNKPTDFRFGEPDEIQPLVRLSDAEARIAELEAENARHLAEIDRKSSMPGDYRYWEGRYRDAEALLNEAGKVLEPFADVATEYDEESDGQQVWPTFTIGDFRAARAIHDKIGVKDE